MLRSRHIAIVAAAVVSLSFSGFVPVLLVHSQTIPVDIVVSGVSSNDNVTISMATPVPGGGFVSDENLGILHGNQSISFALPLSDNYVAASFVTVSPGVRLAPVDRPQKVNTPSQQITFLYQTEYAFSPTIWYRGSIPGNGGNISQASGWFVSGTKIALTASPDSGWVFAWWVIIPKVSWSASQNHLNLGFTSTLNPYLITMSSPNDALGFFVPKVHLSLDQSVNPKIL